LLKGSIQTSIIGSKLAGSLNKLNEYRMLRNVLVSAIPRSIGTFLNCLHHVDPKHFVKSLSKQRKEIPVE